MRIKFIELVTYEMNQKGPNNVDKLIPVTAQSQYTALLFGLVQPVLVFKRIMDKTFINDDII